MSNNRFSMFDDIPYRNNAETSARAEYNDPMYFTTGETDKEYIESHRYRINAGLVPQFVNRRPIGALAMERGYSPRSIRMVGLAAITVYHPAVDRLILYVTDDILSVVTPHEADALADMIERADTMLPNGGYAGLMVNDESVIRVYILSRGKLNDIARDDDGNVILQNGHLVILPPRRKEKKNKVYRRNRRVW